MGELDDSDIAGPWDGSAVEGYCSEAGEQLANRQARMRTMAESRKSGFRENRTAQTKEISVVDFFVFSIILLMNLKTSFGGSLVNRKVPSALKRSVTLSTA
jgi:hypothetical protein